VLSPARYTGISYADGAFRIDPAAPAYADDGWLTVLDDSVLTALVRGFNPMLIVEGLRVVDAGVEQPECEEVALTRFSTGAAFQFSPRKSLPLTVV
jgi:hypothetical protein